MEKKWYYIIAVIVILVLLKFLAEEYMFGFAFMVVPLLFIIGIPTLLLYFIFRMKDKQKMKIALGVLAFFIHNYNIFLNVTILFYYIRHFEKTTTKTNFHQPTR